MGIRPWQIIAILLLAACKREQSADGSMDAVPDSSIQDMGTQSNMDNGQGAQPNPATGDEKPAVDLQLVSIDMPGSVDRNTEFPITVTVRNNSGTALSFAELEARAILNRVTSATDLGIGSGAARDIGPNGDVTATFQARAPHVPGPAQIIVRAKPGLATDPNPANNERSQNIVVN